MGLRDFKSHIFSYRTFHDCLASNSRLTSSREMVLGKNCVFFFKITQRVSRVSRTFIATNSFSRKRVCFSGPFRDCLTTNLLLYNPRKLRVFNFLCSRCDLFFKSFQLPSLKSLEPLSTQITIYSNPFIFKQDICKISSRYVLLTPFFIFPLKIM